MWLRWLNVGDYLFGLPVFRLGWAGDHLLPFPQRRVLSVVGDHVPSLRLGASIISSDATAAVYPTQDLSFLSFARDGTLRLSFPSGAVLQKCARGLMFANDRHSEGRGVSWERKKKREIIMHARWHYVRVPGVGFWRRLLLATGPTLPARWLSDRNNWGRGMGLLTHYCLSATCMLRPPLADSLCSLDASCARATRRFSQKRCGLLLLAERASLLFCE